MTIVGVAMSEVWTEYKEKIELENKAKVGIVNEKTLGEQITDLLQQVMLKQSELEGMRNQEQQGRQEQQKVSGLAEMDVATPTGDEKPKKKKKKQQQQSASKDVRHSEDG